MQPALDAAVRRRPSPMGDPPILRGRNKAIRLPPALAACRASAVPRHAACRHTGCTLSGRRSVGGYDGPESWPGPGRALSGSRTALGAAARTRDAMSRVAGRSLSPRASCPARRARLCRRPSIYMRLVVLSFFIILSFFIFPSAARTLRAAGPRAAPGQLIRDIKPVTSRPEQKETGQSDRSGLGWAGRAYSLHRQQHASLPTGWPAPARPSARA